MQRSPFLVDTSWLQSHLDDDNLSIVDASWYLPAMNRNGKEEFEQSHIPGAVYFDIDAIADKDSPLPHTLASPESFAMHVEALGVSNTDTIVVYDGIGLFSAARVWWNFRIMGATKVVLLDGGFPAWLEAGLPLESGTKPIKRGTFQASYNPAAVTSFDEMQNIVATGKSQIADARPTGRFTGEDAEPRAGMRSGHMPGSCSLPASSLSRNGKLLSSEDLKAAFQNAGLDLQGPITTTCGSGVTAAIITLALETLGHSNHSLYDGSWSEWGGREDTDIVKGAS